MFALGVKGNIVNVKKEREVEHFKISLTLLCSVCSTDSLEL